MWGGSSLSAKCRPEQAAGVKYNEILLNFGAQYLYLLGAAPAPYQFSVPDARPEQRPIAGESGVPRPPPAPHQTRRRLASASASCLYARRDQTSADVTAGGHALLPTRGGAGSCGRRCGGGRSGASSQGRGRGCRSCRSGCCAAAAAAVTPAAKRVRGGTSAAAKNWCQTLSQAKIFARVFIAREGLHNP